MPFISAVLFSRQLKANDVNVVFEGSGHGFLNRKPDLDQTTAELDQFTVSLG